jgi:hypothetical protein
MSRGTIWPCRTTASWRARHAEDGDLGVVDDRNRRGAAQRADIGDREGAAAQVVEGGLAVADTLRQRAELPGDLQ